MNDNGLKIYPIPALKDNYIWAIINNKLSVAAIVDPGETQPVLDFLNENQLKLTAILITHHHWDHTNGVMELKNTCKVPVYGPANSNIEGITTPLNDGDRVNLDTIGLPLNVLRIPGHTLDHIAYYGDDMLFCGDTLFSAGCGRVFEGTMQQMHDSLQILAALPDQTKVYCAHEYTVNNLNFAKLVEPDNPHIQQHLDHAVSLREAGKVTLPSTLGDEKKFNPFLRTNTTDVVHTTAKECKQSLSTPGEVFAALRHWKDNF